MNKNSKIIIGIIVVICVVLTAGVLYGYVGSSSFYANMANISAEEKLAYISVDDAVSENVTNPVDIIEEENDYIISLNESIKKLDGSKWMIQNETIKQYIDLEITQRQNQIKLCKDIIELNNIKQEYNADHFGYGQYKLQVDTAMDKINETKKSVDTTKDMKKQLLNAHSDIKSQLKSEGVDV